MNFFWCVQLIAASQATKKNSESEVVESPATSSTTSAPSIFLKVHLYSTLEVKQTTTMQMPLNLLMSDVFDKICLKRKYDPKDYVLKMADVKTNVPLDKTLEALKCNEFCVLKKSTGGGIYSPVQIFIIL